MRRNAYPAGGSLASASDLTRVSRKHRWWRRAVICALAPSILSGCYTYRPVVATQPVAGTRVDLHLTDEGRIAVRERIGPDVARVEGSLVYRNDTSFVLRVAEVHGLYGARNVWGGEEVGIRRDYVGLVRERRFDTMRSVLLGGLVVAALVVIFATDLVGFGGDSDVWREPPDPGEQ